MRQDTKTWTLLLLLLAFFVLLLIFLKRKATTQTGVMIPQIGEATQFPERTTQDLLNAALIRICHYPSADITWPIDTKCAPTFNGETLSSDELTRRL
jgi:hypothetical protein